MTDKGLLCSKPYEIGLMASVNFIGFTIGSFLFVRLADIYGRKPVLLISSAVTPIGVVCIILWGNSLTNIYIIVFVMGLTYSTRASVSYLLATEYLTENK
jgi:MFS family permease